MMGLDSVLNTVMLESDMSSMLYHDFGVTLSDPESTPSERHLATLFRCTISRRRGELGLGGKKYVNFYVDMYVFLNRSPAAFIQNLRRDLRVTIKGAFWTDYLMSMWGYGRKRGNTCQQT